MRDTHTRCIPNFSECYHAGCRRHYSRASPPPAGNGGVLCVQTAHHRVLQSDLSRWSCRRLHSRAHLGHLPPATAACCMRGRSAASRCTWKPCAACCPRSASMPRQRFTCKCHRRLHDASEIVELSKSFVMTCCVCGRCGGHHAVPGSTVQPAARETSGFKTCSVEQAVSQNDSDQ